jgi:hypothetical protein
MHRLTARLLLFFALVGSLAPLALAATAAPPHACCVRKAVHPCHDSLASESVSETGQLVIRDANCCNGDCGRAVTTAQWAHAQSLAGTFDAPPVETHLGQPYLDSPNAKVFRFESTRAPPQFSLA